MWDDPVAVAWRSSGVPPMYPAPPTSCRGNGEDCRVPANSSPLLLTPCGLKKDFGVFRADSMSLGPVLVLVWVLENLNVVMFLASGNPPQHQQEPAGTSLQLRLQQFPHQGKVPVLFPFLHQQTRLLGSKRSCTYLEGAHTPGSR